MKKNKPLSGIKAKTTIYTLIPVIISFIILTSILFVSLFNSQREIAISEFKNIARRHAANFERKINNALDYLSSVTSVLEFQVYEGMTDREALQRIIYYIFDGHTVDSGSIYFEPDMYDGKDADYRSTVYGTALTGRIGYYFYRYNGRTGYRQEALENDIEFTLPLYTITKELGAPTYTEPGVFIIDGVETLKFSIAYPIRDLNNEFIGVITADIFLEDIHAEIHAEKIFETGYIIITNDKEQLVYSPRFEDIGKTRGEGGIQYPLPFYHNTTSEVFNATSIINNKNTLVSGQMIYFPQFNGSFYVSVAAPVSEINANGTRLLLIVIAVSAAILIFIALFLHYLISRMTKPLIEFSQSAERIALGDYSVRIKGRYQDEFAVLGEAMNTMTKRIQNVFNILHNILNGIDAAVYVTDPRTGEILFVNDRVKKEFNLKGDVIGLFCFNVFQNSDVPCEFCPCIKLNKDPNTPVVWEEHNAITKRFYQNTDCYIDWIGGTKVHLQHSVNITDLKIITEEKSKAEEMSRMKSTFLANMSHEIRTPMNAILGVTEIMIQQETTPEIEEGLNKIYSSCNLLMGIINDILDFSKIEAGKLDIVPIQYNIASLINDSVNLNMMRMDSKPIEFELNVDENIPANLIGDELRIKQIFNNLLSNAFKYTDAGKVTLTVGFEPDSLTNSQITLVIGIRDTGHGMTKEQLSKMFEEYSRFNQNANIAVEGTGLGLAITRRLINLMNGKMSVESEYKKGSYFVVHLPQKIIDDEKLGKEVVENLRLFRMDYMTNKKNRQITRDPMPYGNILVVDDVETNIYVAVGLLKMYRLNIDTAMRGQEAIDKINEGKVYDIVFMDHMMPEMDGIEAVKIIRNHGYTAPIIALTANAVMGQSSMFLQNGFDDFISKPIDIRQLNSILNRFVRDKYPPEVVEAARLEYSKAGADAGGDETDTPKIDSLLLESFIRDAKKVISIMEEQSFCFNDEDVLYKFIVIVHGIKSSLWNIGEMELADFASKLEKDGRERNIEIITEAAPIFMESLRKLLENLELIQSEDSGFEITQDEDINDLRSKLADIVEKAADYDRKGVLDKLAKIKTGSKETKIVVDNIVKHILHSNFEEAKDAAEVYMSVLGIEE